MPSIRNNVDESAVEFAAKWRCVPCCRSALSVTSPASSTIDETATLERMRGGTQHKLLRIRRKAVINRYCTIPYAHHGSQRVINHKLGEMIYACMPQCVNAPHQSTSCTCSNQTFPSQTIHTHAQTRQRHPQRIYRSPCRLQYSYWSNAHAPFCISTAANGYEYVLPYAFGGRHQRQSMGMIYIWFRALLTAGNGLNIPTG